MQQITRYCLVCFNLEFPYGRFLPNQHVQPAVDDICIDTLEDTKTATDIVVDALSENENVCKK